MTSNPIVKFFYVLWYLPVFVGLTIVASSICLVVSLFSTRATRYITNVIWSHITLDPAGIRLCTIGRENLPGSDDDGPDGTGGFIVYANHTSLTDIPAISLAVGRPVSFVAKASLGKIPFFGWAMVKAHMLVNREGGADAAKQMVEEASRRLENNEILVIFPEGTRNKGSEPLLPFKKGTFILAKHSGAPIVPMAVKNGRAIWPSGKFWPRPGTVKIKIGQPLPLKPGENLNSLTARAQAVLAEMLTDESW
jgi:1-acyl-sn-glycerol-3-phosphate acyltransferase